MRNPWGNEVWNGDWSDTSSRWTSRLKQEVDFEKKNEGIFYMSVEDLYSRLSATFINHDTSDWTLCYFAMFDDPAEQNGSDRSCGRSCTKHALKITSHVDQTIWIGAHTWQYYGYGNSEWCPRPSNKLLD